MLQGIAQKKRGHGRHSATFQANQSIKQRGGQGGKGRSAYGGSVLVCVLRARRRSIYPNLNQQASGNRITSRMRAAMPTSSKLVYGSSSLSLR
mmetsp:Transcript_6658/g.17819  ORF Transcript_6658/g.17819 Transcript_6658/m.17819 type:complete len:93 (+) Transcript_6658:808-1086(+)